MNKILNRYNKLMTSLGLEHITINTNYSEGTEKWNLRDMIVEADYQLSKYYESDTIQSEIKEYDYKSWISETGKLKRFINKYKDDIKNIKCSEKHCSKYDN